MHRSRPLEGANLGYPAIDRTGRLVLDTGEALDTLALGLLAEAGIEEVWVLDAGDRPVPAASGLAADRRHDMAEALLTVEREVPERMTAAGLDPESIVAGGVPRGVLGDCLLPALDAAGQIAQDAGEHPLLYPHQPAAARVPGVLAEHGIAVALVASRIARAMNARGALLRDITCGALLHDVGKLLLPGIAAETDLAVWTAEELTLYRAHPGVGAAVAMRAFPDQPAIAATIRGHHEHQDGSGFPRGVASDNETAIAAVPAPARIPAGAEICAVADMYVHMLEDDPDMDERGAATRMARMVGSRFNAAVHAALDRIVPTHRAGACVRISGGAFDGRHAAVIRQGHDPARPLVRPAAVEGAATTPDPFDTSAAAVRALLACGPARQDGH